MISLLKFVNNLLWSFLSLFPEECLICSFKIFLVVIFPEMINSSSKTSFWAHDLIRPIIILQSLKKNQLHFCRDLIKVHSTNHLWCCFRLDCNACRLNISLHVLCNRLSLRNGISHINIIIKLHIHHLI